MVHPLVTVANFFTAMQAGRAAGAELAGLFAPDAVYVEPFSGTAQRHVGRGAILAAFARGWDYPLPDMHVRIDHAQTDGAEIHIAWTCFSPGLPGGSGSGRNRYLMGEDGLILELETTVDSEGPA
jgi:hypothetical protein